MAGASLNGKKGYIDERGNELISFKYNTADDFSEGIARVGLNTNSKSKYGYIDKTGKEIIPLKYDYAGDFSEGLVNVTIEDNGVYKSGYIDKTGKVVISFKYDSGSNFRDGLAEVNLDDKYGYIDKSGKEVVPIKYDQTYYLEKGLYMVSVANKMGLLKSPLVEENLKVEIVDKTINAVPAASKVLVNGKDKSFDAYLIGGSNYFKLRDLAAVVNGTEKEFEVTWDENKKRLILFQINPIQKWGEK